MRPNGSEGGLRRHTTVMQKDEESTRQERADDEYPAPPPGELIAVTDGNEDCQTDAQTPEQSCRSRVVKGVRWFRPRNAHPGIGPNLHDDRRHEKARGKDYRDNQQDKGTRHSYTALGSAWRQGSQI